MSLRWDRARWVGGGCYLQPAAGIRPGRGRAINLGGDRFRPVDVAVLILLSMSRGGNVKPLLSAFYRPEKNYF